MYHLGIYRDRVTLQPVECSSHNTRNKRLFADRIIADYSKLPENPPIDRVYLLDPLIATGGTALAALAMILEWGIPRKCFQGVGNKFKV